jgi:hypothetical protein
MTPVGKARWKRRLRTLVWVVLVVVGVPAAVHYFLRWSADRELARAVAEADRLDPGWRLEELEANRAEVADSENSALRILAIKKAMPVKWPNLPRALPVNHRLVIRDTDSEGGGQETQIRALAPQYQFSPDMIQLMRQDLKNMEGVLPDARSLADFPRGRYPMEYTRHFLDTAVVSDEGEVVAKLLWIDAIMAAQEQHIDKALIAAVALLNTSRSIADEPILASQSHRLSIQKLALVTIERILAQGQASGKELEAVQRLLEEEGEEPLLLHAFRAERAGTYRHMRAVLSGRWKYTLRFYQGRFANKVPLSWNRYIDMVIVRRNYPAYFRLLTALVEIAKLPAQERLPQIELLERQARQLPKEFTAWFQSTAHSADAFSRNEAWLRCAIAGIAAERFRLAHGSWPDSLSALTPEFLLETPIDPFDGQPLRLRQRKDSLVIYSIGPDGNDDGGVVSRTDFHSAGSDVGFQLWDVSSRRQPAPPPVKPMTEGDEESTP